MVTYLVFVALIGVACMAVAFAADVWERRERRRRIQRLRERRRYLDGLEPKRWA